MPAHTAGKSKVVIARDASLHGAGAQPDEQRVLYLLDKAMAAYTGRDKPLEAWKSIIPASILAGKTIGLKVNGLGGRGISTHAALILAIAERLQQAGVRAGNIVVWERDARSLQACGMTVNTDSSHVRCYGNDVGGYEDAAGAMRPSAGSPGEDSHARVRDGDQSCRFSKITKWRASRSP